MESAKVPLSWRLSSRKLDVVVVKKAAPLQSVRILRGSARSLLVGEEGRPNFDPLTQDYAWLSARQNMKDSFNAFYHIVFVTLINNGIPAMFEALLAWWHEQTVLDAAQTAEDSMAIQSVPSMH